MSVFVDARDRRHGPIGGRRCCRTNIAGRHRPAPVYAWSCWPPAQRTTMATIPLCAALVSVASPHPMTNIQITCSPIRNKIATAVGPLTCTSLESAESSPSCIVLPQMYIAMLSLYSEFCHGNCVYSSVCFAARLLQMTR